MTQERLRKEWQGIIAQYEASGKKQSIWCRESGINARSLNRWYNKLKKEASTSPAIRGWVPVEIGEEFQNSPINLRIGKVNVEVKEGFQPSLLIKIVKVLGDIC